MEYGYAVFTVQIFVIAILFAAFYLLLKAISWGWKCLIRETEGNGHRPAARVPTPGTGPSEKIPDCQEMARELKAMREEWARVHEKLAKAERMPADRAPVIEESIQSIRHLREDIAATSRSIATHCKS